MKAAILDGVHQPLHYRDTPDPEPAAHEVVIRLQAAALNHRDVWIQQGLYAGLKFPIILGSDGVGIVEAVGSGVEPTWLGKAVVINPALDWGDNPRAQKREFRVLGLPDNGTFAELIKIPVSNICAKPAHLSAHEAAALPLAGATAYRALFTRAVLHDTDRVLVTGIGGGVALLALQFAAACGAQVHVTSGSDEKIERAIALGAAGGARYNQENWVKQLKAKCGGFDLIIDSAGGDGFDDLVDLAAPGGRIVTYGATLGLPSRLDLRRVFWKQLDIQGTTLGTRDDFDAMLQFVQSRHVKPVVDQVYPLAEAEQAMRRMDDGRQFGKLVLAIEG